MKHLSKKSSIKESNINGSLEQIVIKFIQKIAIRNGYSPYDSFTAIEGIMNRIKGKFGEGKYDLEEATKEEVINQKELNKELEKTSKITKDINIEETHGPEITDENELIKAIVRAGKKSKPFLDKLVKLLQDMGAGAGTALRFEGRKKKNQDDGGEEIEDNYYKADKDDDSSEFEKKPTKKDFKKDSTSNTALQLQSAVEKMRKIATALRFEGRKKKNQDDGGEEIEDNYYKADKDDDSSEFEKEPTKKDFKKDSTSNTALQLQSAVEKMKKIAKLYKSSEGDKKEKYLNQLKDLTKTKKKLEGSL